MILVQNHRLPLSGSKILAFVLLLGTLGACAPKVLRPGGGSKDTKEPSKEAPTKEERKERDKEIVEKRHFNNIALLLPFQLDKVVDSLPGKRDVERASLALDFYQGFKLGLDNLTRNGNNFKLEVLDSRDNAGEVKRLAVGKSVEEAALIVGPIFPTEIDAFSTAANLAGKLQISPLAARSPSQYQTNKLVTVTPPIGVHAQVLANYIASEFEIGDHVVIINNIDEDSEKLLVPLRASLDKLDVKYNEVTDLGEIEINLNTVGRNIVVNASTNQFFIAQLLAGLYKLKTESAYDISLIGHPNWSRFDLNPDYLAALRTSISSSYFVDEKNLEVQQFKRDYFSSFNVNPTEFAFKGYDTGVFFGRLLAMYPKDYADRLLKEKHKGVSIGFEFVRDPATGYVNNSVRLLQFNGQSYRPL
ncbi:amino acid ABC transporter substrate-binding protein [Olivibacter sp. XZL3]|uniref:amino acid ABC transporter substrate-binding protein n=1 Tax=Olivibacter sp. XZL3 TaxID=1735116 RepID=UPI001064A59E|nr:amino acid ABC transporter substrate-binding protein [Olivibacter sp. XZL3]